MPVEKCFFTFKQVQDKMHALALGILTDTANMLGDHYNGRLHVTMHGDAKLVSLMVDMYEFHFYHKKLRVSFSPSVLLKADNNEKLPLTLIEFTLEKKVYSDSPHNSKVTYYGGAKTGKYIMQFINEVMGDEKPERRFKLKTFSQVP